MNLVVRGCYRNGLDVEPIPNERHRSDDTDHREDVPQSFLCGFFLDVLVVGFGDGRTGRGGTGLVVCHDYSLVV